ncbi:DUF4097 family beta strand repeat-containing protein [Zhihengliuella somnathii]
MKRPLAVLAAVALLAVTTGCAAPAPAPVIGDDSETRSFDFTGDALTIDSHNGSVQVTARDVDEVQVRRELTGSVFIGSDTANWSLSGDHLDLERHCTGILATCRTAYQVVIPRGVALELHGRNGRIQAAQLDDGLAVTTRNGPVQVEQVSGGVSVESRNGRITVDDVEGRLQATTRNGGIDVRQARSDVMQLKSNNGKVLAQLAAEPRDVDITTNNGAVVLEVPGGPYDVAVRTDNGQQSVQVPTDGTSVQRIRVETDNGAVTIRN